MNVKVVLVGAGSYGWGPTILGNILSKEHLDGCHVVLHDLNAEALAMNSELAERYQQACGASITFEQTTEQSAAFDGADYVVVTISTGGLRTMRPDLEIPEKYGIFQTVGDTTGPGGLSRALRNIPVFLEMARNMEELCFGSLYALRCGIMLGREIGALPAIGDRHMCEFLPTFVQSEENVEAFGLTRTSIAEREEHYRDAKARIERMLSGEEEIKIERGTDVVGVAHADDVGGWIVALEGGPAVEDNLNVPNIGQIPELPLGAVVETRGILDATGIRPIASPMPPAIEAIVRPHVLREELTVEAAVEGDFEKAVAALATDPLVARPDLARPMLRELMEANRDWLPQFSLA